MERAILKTITLYAKPTMSFEEAKKKYVGRKFNARLKRELEIQGFAFGVSMATGKITGLYWSAFEDPP